MIIITVHGLYYIKLVSAKTLFILWISLSSCTSALDEAQTFSVREPGSLDVTGYTCNSYIKQFSSVDQVTFNFMGVVGEPCLCSLNVSPSVSLSDDDIVLSILFQSFTRSVEYKLFKECSEDLTFQVASQSATQINIIVRCGNDYHVNDVNTENPIVMTKPEEFSASISMRCQSENEITTSVIQSSTDPKTVITSTDSSTKSSSLSMSPFPTTDSKGERGQISSNQTGLIAGTVVGILVVAGVAIAVVLIIINISNKKHSTMHNASGERHVYENQDAVNPTGVSDDSGQYSGLEGRYRDTTDYASLETTQTEDSMHYEITEGIQGQQAGSNSPKNDHSYLDIL